MGLTRVSKNEVAFSEPMWGRNAIINGNFDVWQRNTTHSVSGYGSVDRWGVYINGSTMVHSRQTFTTGQSDVPYNPKYYSRTVVTSSAGADNYVSLQQAIEGVDTFSGETVTLSFWAKADSTKNIVSEFRQVMGTGGTPSDIVSGIGTTTHSLTTSWKKFTSTVTIPNVGGNTLGTNGDDCLRLRFWFDAGSNLDSVTNSLGQQSGTFDIAQVQLERGQYATDYEIKTLGEELWACKRYYQSIQIGNNTTLGTHRASTTTYLEGLLWHLDVPLRTKHPNASCSVIDGIGGSTYALGVLRSANGGTVKTGTGIGFWVDTELMLAGGVYDQTGLSTGLPYLVQTNGGTPLITVDAEL